MTSIFRDKTLRSLVEFTDVSEETPVSRKWVPQVTMKRR
jgi:hypothetical protein